MFNIKKRHLVIVAVVAILVGMSAALMNIPLQLTGAMGAIIVAVLAGFMWREK